MSSPELIKQNVRNIDALFHTAAVADFDVTNQAKEKLSSSESHTLVLTPREKILDQIKILNPAHNPDCL